MLIIPTPIQFAHIHRRGGRKFRAILITGGGPRMLLFPVVTSAPRYTSVTSQWAKVKICFEMRQFPDPFYLCCCDGICSRGGQISYFLRTPESTLCHLNDKCEGCCLAFLAD